MLVETDNLVSEEEFQKDLEKYAAAAQEGNGPVAITRGPRIIGYWVSPEEYELMFGAAVRNLLASRAKGPTLSQEEARAVIRKILRRQARK